MTEQQNAKALRIVFLALLLAGIALRWWVNLSAFDEDGLLKIGSRALTVTVAFSVIAFCALASFCLRLNRQPGTDACFAAPPLLLAPALMGAVFVCFGSVIRLLDEANPLDAPERLLQFGGIAAGALMFAAALLRGKRERTCFWLQFLLMLFVGARMILGFRKWSQDPAVIDTIFLLLANVTATLSVVLQAAFSLRVGHRRSTALFGLLCAVFSFAAVIDRFFHKLPDGEPLLLLGFGLWSATAALRLLQTVEPPAAPEETPEE